MKVLPKVRGLARNQTGVVAAIAVAIFFVILAARWYGSFQWLELQAYDAFLRARAIEPPTDRRIVIVAAGEEEIARLGWPLPDAVLAELLGRLLEHDPEVVGVDIYRDRPVGNHAERLHDLLAAHDNIIWVSKFGGEWSPAVTPPEPLQNTDRVGFADMIPDPDGTVRRGILFVDDGTTVAFSFSLRLALRYLVARGIFPAPGDHDPNYIRLGRTTIPPFEANDGGYVDADSSGYQFLLGFKYGAPAFPRIALGTVLRGGMQQDLVRGKIVLVGVMSETVKDFFYTPFNRGAGQAGFGVELQGEITDQIIRHALEGDPIPHSLSEGQEAGWILLWTAVGAAIAGWLRSPLWFALAIGAGIFGAFGVAYVAFIQSWWIPTVPAALGTIGSAGLGVSYISYRERRERARLMGLFSRHVSGPVADEIWRHRDEFLDHGRPEPRLLQATVLFVDIRGFTPAAESLEPAALVDWLNRFLGLMARVVALHGGVVDKFMGDAVMALFGVPLPCRDARQIAEQARKAAHCALDMGRELERLNVNLRADGLPAIAVRIGIHTGDLVAGSVGSAERSEYTVVGDTVNTAARLESFAEQLAGSVTDHASCTIAISGATLVWLDDTFRTRKIGEVQLKGKAEKVLVYHLIDFAGSAGEAGDVRP